MINFSLPRITEYSYNLIGISCGLQGSYDNVSDITEKTLSRLKEEQQKTSKDIEKANYEYEQTLSVLENNRKTISNLNRQKENEKERIRREQYELNHLTKPSSPGYNASESEKAIYASNIESYQRMSDALRQSIRAAEERIRKIEDRIREAQFSIRDLEIIKDNIQKDKSILERQYKQFSDYCGILFDNLKKLSYETRLSINAINNIQSNIARVRSLIENKLCPVISQVAADCNPYEIDYYGVHLDSDYKNLALRIESILELLQDKSERLQSDINKYKSQITDNISQLTEEIVVSLLSQIKDTHQLLNEKCMCYREISSIFSEYMGMTVVR